MPSKPKKGIPITQVQGNRGPGGVTQYGVNAQPIPRDPAAPPAEPYAAPPPTPLWEDPTYVQTAGDKKVGQRRGVVFDDGSGSEPEPTLTPPEDSGDLQSLPTPTRTPDLGPAKE